MVSHAVTYASPRTSATMLRSSPRLYGNNPLVCRTFVMALRFLAGLHKSAAIATHLLFCLLFLAAFVALGTVLPRRPGAKERRRSEALVLARRAPCLAACERAALFDRRTAVHTPSQDSRHTGGTG